MTEPDPMNILPPEYQTMLKKKSSRDPSTRFATKLHLLLNYVENNPGLEDKIGCAWVTEDEFRINKKTLVKIMGIKVNTLNVNLSTLKFDQQKHNKDGWTMWKRPGFTKSAQDFPDPNSFAQIPKQPKSFTIHFNLGEMTYQDAERFGQVCRQLWTELVGPEDRPVETTSFITQAATRFKQPEQPLDNAIDVLRAIIAPNQDQRVIDYNQFCKFMAMFGPENTIMLKIASLLSCSNDNGQWLIFSKDANMATNPLIQGAFDDQQPNCLVIHTRSHQYKIWNLPNEEALKSKYIIDQSHTFYSSWEEYFQNNPIPIQQEYLYPSY